ncbi:homeobox domain-containing protein [Candidatus Bathyarchaeota archaeon]|nr:homeobox domain-containing protein [Candidatus Bathyarchaeota archaeon]
MSPATTRARHSRASTAILKEWFREHYSYPYPTEDEKEALGALTGLGIRQISYWFVNARRRNTVKPDAHGPPSGQPPSSGRAPELARSDAWDGMAPLDRWRNSPPEEEPAPWAAIERAVESTTSSHSAGLGSGGGLLPSDSVSSADVSSQSQSSNSSAHSYSSGSVASLHSLGARAGSRRRRRGNSDRERRRPRNPLVEDHGRIYQCTFCTDSFRHKYDWTRHERTLHLALEKWTCSPLGPVHLRPGETASRCVFCDEMDPSAGHIEAHDANNCMAKPSAARSFYRKDHFRQHLRLSHHVDKVLPSMKDWASKITQIKSRCGFCQETFTLWSERNDHLAAHFRDGALMKNWKGCRGLEPAVALLVQNSMPPYLIGLESRNFEPFSASRGGVRAGHSVADKPAPPTVYQLLTAQLGDFVQVSRTDGVGITNDTIQRQARLIIYGDDDPWNQTPADNPEWMNLFKTAHGLSSTTQAQDPLTTALPCDMPTAPSPLALEKLYQASASDIGAEHLEFCARDPGTAGFSVPWPWQSPESLAEFSQMDRMPPLTTLGVDGGYAGLDLSAGMPGLNYVNPLDGILGLPMSEEDLFGSIFPFEVGGQADGDGGQ